MSTTLDINGAICSPTSPDTTTTLGGGFDLDAESAGFIGTGSLAGTVSAGTAKLKLTGAVAPASSPM
ncbi:MAG TPA: hypothetical protein VMT64_14110 [Candidatus Binataceae bacterium]|nr:hypothetical protein [Candidatus Binataceae bacterium]